MSDKYIDGIASVVKCFGYLVLGINRHPPIWLPLSEALLNFPTRLGIVINVNEFTLGTIHEMWRTTWGFPHEVFLGKNNNE